MGGAGVIHEIQYAVVHQRELYEMEVCQPCHNLDLPRFEVDFRDAHHAIIFKNCVELFSGHVYQYLLFPIVFYEPFPVPVQEAVEFYGCLPNHLCVLVEILVLVGLEVEQDQGVAYGKKRVINRFKIQCPLSDVNTRTHYKMGVVILRGKEPSSAKSFKFTEFLCICTIVQTFLVEDVLQKMAVGIASLEIMVI